MGAEVTATGEVSVRLWAPSHKTVHVTIDDRSYELRASDDGYFHAVVPGGPGSRYGFVLDDDPRTYPDPVSRFQPDGPEGLSEVIDPSTHQWGDQSWPGVTLAGQVLYEMHAGTFTPEGTWSAAAHELPRLRELGITALQVMPVAEFAGRFGWGYDGVLWFAPSHLYGRPDDLRMFVDRAHASGLAVILDVVYNHLGPSGNWLPTFSRHYISSRYRNEWGAPLNFDGVASGPVREVVLTNIQYWITEFHIDGFRLDATQQIFDASDVPVIAAITECARRTTHRDVIVLGENEPQQAALLRSRAVGGYGLDAVYNDDFHHAARVALTGIREAYYSDYHGTSRELLSAVLWGFLFQGQRYSWQKGPRGTPALDVAPPHFVACLENHDQVANSLSGRRLSELAHPGDLRALTALLLLLPGTPMLFQGQESGSTVPWLYFADHRDGLGANVRKGRRAFLAQFARLKDDAIAARLPDPTDPRTFEACRLTHEADARSERFRALHRDLLVLRSASVFSAQQRPSGACLTDRALLLRAGEDLATSLLLVNLGGDVDIAAASEPLIAPPAEARWRVRWSSEHPAYGGAGMPPWSDSQWIVPAHAAVVLDAAPVTAHDTTDPT